MYTFRIPLKTLFLSGICQNFAVDISTTHIWVKYHKSKLKQFEDPNSGTSDVIKMNLFQTPKRLKIPPCGKTFKSSKALIFPSIMSCRFCGRCLGNVSKLWRSQNLFKNPSNWISTMIAIRPLFWCLEFGGVPNGKQAQISSWRTWLIACCLRFNNCSKGSSTKSRVVLRIQTFGLAGGIWNRMGLKMWHSIRG